MSSQPSHTTPTKVRKYADRVGDELRAAGSWQDPDGRKWLSGSAARGALSRPRQHVGRPTLARLIDRHERVTGGKATCRHHGWT